MANVSGNSRNDEQMELPPGFRFHPSDEELITYYLYPKVVDSSFCARAIGEVDLNKVEPWDLPWKAKIGEREWYFFCARDRKYPRGLRTNRATEAGYWKATGKDKDIFKGKALIGTKKTLVFYRGRAPRGEKTNWIMHEYRLDGKYSTNKQPKTTKNDWVICRIFFKNLSGKNTHISDLFPQSNYDHEFHSSGLPPLRDLSHNNHISKPTADTSHVTCFSKPLENQKPQKSMTQSSEPPLIASSSSTNPSLFSNSSLFFPELSAPTSFFANQSESYMGNMLFTDTVLVQEQSLLKLLLENDGQKMKSNNNPKTELSQETAISTDISSAVSNHEVGNRLPENQDYLISSAGNMELDSIWNY